MSMFRMLPLGAYLALSAALAGCSPRPAQVAKAAPPPPPARTAPARPSTPAGQLARGDVEEALLQGPPWLLRRVPVEEVIRGGAFVGWKILALPEGWNRADLKPGDVVTKVNGATLERPDDLYTAWRNLASASELRIDYEREGAARQLVLPIAGAPSNKVVKALETDAPPSRRPTAARQRTTTVIEEDDGTPPEGDDP